MKFLPLCPAFVVALSSCSPSQGASSIMVEAPDYGPIGEGMKFLALALLGAVVVFSIASLINNKNDHD